MGVPLTKGQRPWWTAALALMVLLLALDLAFPPPLERLQAVSPVVVDREGRWLQAFTAPDGRWRLTADLDTLDPVFLDRLIAVEDKRFYIHPGVDPLAMGRAVASLVRRGEVVSGGSTITMQLARLIEPRPRTVGAKLIEMVRAVQIERRMSKREILEAYLTMAPYGGNLQGVRAAGRAYFGRDPDTLDDADMALLIALPQAPEARRPDRRPEAARAARARVLRFLAARGHLSPEALAEADAAPIPARQPFPRRAPHASSRMASSLPGPVIRSTLDAPLQATLEPLVEAAAEAQGPAVSAAVVVVEIAGRRLRASIGGAGQERPGGYIDMTRAVRSPGSALKPFIYAIAFDDGVAAPETLLADTPQRFSGYMPENFDRRFHGDVSAAEALRHSLNLPAVATLDRVGPGRFEAALIQAGAPPVIPDRAGAAPSLALALGGAGLRLEDVTLLYAALGDRGRSQPLTLTEPVTTRPRRWIEPETARRVLGILADTPTPAGRAPAQLALDAPVVAFKTGTSYGYRDAWGCAVSGGYAVCVWVGRADGAPVPGMTGRNAALPLLFQVIDRLPPLAGLARTAPLTAPEEPPAAPALERLGPVAAGQGAQILFPVDGSEVVVTDLGPAARGLALAAQGGAPPLRWYAEGRELPREATSGRVIWRPLAPGFHRVDVVDAEGRRSSVRVRIRAEGL